MIPYGIDSRTIAHIGPYRFERIIWTDGAVEYICEDSRMIEMVFINGEINRHSSMIFACDAVN